MKIYVDADACPVKETIMTIAKEERIPVVFVMSYAHYSPVTLSEQVQVIYVAQGSDAADYQIMKLAQAGDIIITQDYGLASLGLAKQCYVLHHKGFAFTEANMDSLLHSRYLSAKIRRSGGRTKGPKAYTKEDEAKFRALLLDTIVKAKQKKHHENT